MSIKRGETLHITYVIRAVGLAKAHVTHDDDGCLLPSAIETVGGLGVAEQVEEHCGVKL